MPTVGQLYSVFAYFSIGVWLASVMDISLPDKDRQGKPLKYHPVEEKIVVGLCRILIVLGWAPLFAALFVSGSIDD